MSGPRLSSCQSKIQRGDDYDKDDDYDDDFDEKDDDDLWKRSLDCSCVAW